MPIYNTGDWFTLQPGITYRKFELYTMAWSTDMELEQVSVVAAPYGGPIAIVRDSKQFVKVARATTKPVIKIFTAAGYQISTISWNSGNFLTMGWSDAEDLVCVQDDGLVLIYDMFGNYQHTFSMGQEAKDTKIIDARIFQSSSGTGVAVMTTNYRIFLINSIKEPKNRQLPEMPKSALDPTCWAILSEDRNTSCLVARNHELFKLRQGDSVCSLQSVSFEKAFKSIILISVSHNQKSVALITNNGVLWMGSSNLKNKYCEFDTNQSERPRQIEWIMDSENDSNADAVVIAYQSLLLVVTIAGDSNIYTYDQAIFLVPEMDCVRILTSNYHETIQKVPKCVSHIFAINSPEPSSWLFEAYKKYTEQSHRSDEYLCQIKDRLEQSVAECIEASSYEFDTVTQKSLVRTAHFGKAFIPNHNPDEYIKITRILRVLNALRDPNIGIPLTFRQFNHLKPNVILDRLVFRKFYGLAIPIAQHLQLPESRILEHWAFHKVTHDKNDEEVARKISDKLRNESVQGISFCNIAKKAQEVGRTNLAIMLLEFETKSSLKVPLLLKLGQNKKALLSATKSGDTDLVYAVLLQLKETTQMADFQMIVRQFPMAQNLYKKYCQLYSKPGLQEIYNQEDDFVAQAEYALKEGLVNNTVESNLSTASTAYKKAHKDVEADLCEDTRKLLKNQKIFTEKYATARSGDFYGLSIYDTMKRLLQVGDLKQAEKIRSEFKVPERRYWWIRIQLLAENFQWDELEKFSKSKKSPIGYEPFVEVCLKQQNVDEAKKYIPKCSDERKITWYIRAGLIDEAAQASFEQRDLNSLYAVHMITSKSANQALNRKVEEFIAILAEKK